ncbi:MAG: pyruvate ferredoxin oxidoreductase subunit gamma [Thermoplasmata archaeon]|nr:pyruvate ferredoxin oxidoreductase subunit gamma [Thermoplasmata archaeon]
MYEVRFHGRGGQGAVTAANILAVAAFKEGKEVQAFPMFGVERRGAPVMAFTRIDEKPIDVKTLIYNPDFVVVLDPTLMEVVNVTEGLKDGSPVIINTKKNPEEFNLGNYKVYTVDATTIAVENGLGTPMSPIVNTAIIGSFARVSGIVKLESVIEAVRELSPVKKEENVKAAEMAYKAVKGL